MTTHICDLTPSDGDPETAHALLYRHGLPEDVIDGALALFAQELAGKIRAHRDHTRGAVQATKVMDFAADLISPDNWARTVAPAVPAGQAPATDHRLSVQHADALWDAVAIPGPTEPTFTEQHQRVCKAVADILDEMTPAAVLPAPVDRAAALRDFLWRLEQSAGDAAAEKFLDDNPDLAALLAAAASAVVVRRATDETPSEAEPTESVIYEVVGDWGVDGADSAEGAHAAVAKWLRAYPKCGAFAQQRIVREWPDGSEFYGPWTDLPVDEPAVGAQQPKEAVWCSAVALRVHHAGHDWTPQPGMNPVHCVGYPQPKEA